jgi:hypothetical protein
MNESKNVSCKLSFIDLNYIFKEIKLTHNTVNLKYFSSFIMNTIEAAFVPGHSLSVYKCSARGSIIIAKAVTT